MKALTGRMKHLKYVRAKEVEVAIFEVLQTYIVCACIDVDIAIMCIKVLNIFYNK